MILYFIRKQNGFVGYDIRVHTDGRSVIDPRDAPREYISAFKGFLSNNHRNSQY